MSSACVVPSSIVNLSMDNDMLTVLWKEPVQPNDFTWNYTIIVTHINGSELNRAVLSMNVTQLKVSNEKLGMFYP